MFMPDWAVRAFHRATELVCYLESHLQSDGKEWIRCHELARAVEPFLEAGWTIVDGYHGSVQHSWLVREGVILDVYCVARLPMVQVVSGHWVAMDAYKAGAIRRDIRKKALAALDSKLRTCFNHRGERTLFKHTLMTESGYRVPRAPVERVKRARRPSP
jgi:hypothetical protein